MLLERMDDDANCRMNSWIDANNWNVHRIAAVEDAVCAVACPPSAIQITVESY